jgi:dihydrofolate synthase/folylpolyglutamate synthase
MADYRSSIEYLYGLQKYGIKFGLNRTENILARVGNPHLSFRSIHLAGTNGKGSTAAMLSSILTRHGYRTGLYTSPHLVRFTERFRVNDEEAPPEKVLDAFIRMRETWDGSDVPTFFEAVTSMAFLYFAEEKVDWAVIETGMGGRLDATNVIRPEVSVITNVSFDHQAFLGSTLTSIAREKAGIIKSGTPVVTGASQPLVQGVLKAACFRDGSSLYRLGKDFKVRRHGNGTFQYQGMSHRMQGVSLSLVGGHQYNNASVALATLEVLEKEGHLRLDHDVVRDGLQHVRWPARLEVLQQNPLIVLDGAHNPQGAESLREALKQHFSYRNLHLVLGIMADKDIRGMLRRLLPIAETAIFTKPKYHRAANPENLRRWARPFIQKYYVIPDVASAIQQAKSLASPEDLICIAGSLYFAGEVKEMLGEPTL